MASGSNFFARPLQLADGAPLVVFREFLIGKAMKTRLGIALAMTCVCLNAVGAEYCWEAEGCTRYTGVGLAAVRAGDESSFNQRQLAAIRAAKLDALRSLAEQAKGIRLQTQSTNVASELVNDRVDTSLDTTLSGVRYVKVDAIQPGIYQAVVEMDVYQR